MKVAFVAAISSHPVFHTPGEQVDPPLGILHLATLIKDRHEVRIFDGQLYTCTPRRMAQDVLAWQPDVIGFSVNFSTLARNTREMAEYIRAPGVPIVFGGNYATFNWQQLIALPYVDYVAFHEAESSFPLLLEHIADPRRPLPDGVGAKTPSGEVDFRAFSEYIQDLDSLPFVDYDLFDDPGRYAKSIVTTRGCPYTCIYCSTKEMWSKWRYRSARSVATEMLALAERYRTRQVLFADDIFLVVKPRALELCSLLRAAGSPVLWGFSTRLETIDEAIIPTLAAAGCRWIFFGCESGSERVLREMRRHYTRAEMLRKIQVCVALPDRAPLSQHETIIAGIIAGNDPPYRGLAPEAEIWNFVVPLNLETPAHQLAEAVVDAAAAGAHVICCSWFVPDTPRDGSCLWCRAVDMAFDLGAVVVKSAGNRGPHPGTTTCPGNGRRVLAVGATDPAGTRLARSVEGIEFSSLGPTADGRRKPDLVAPGERMCGPVPGNAYAADATGTSYTAPYVAATCALVRQAAPHLAPDAVRQLILSACSPLLGPDGRPVDPLRQGAGRIDVAAALALTRSEAPAGPPSGAGPSRPCRTGATGPATSTPPGPPHRPCPPPGAPGPRPPSPRSCCGRWGGAASTCGCSRPPVPTAGLTWRAP